MGVCDKIMHFVSKSYTILGGSIKKLVYIYAPRCKNASKNEN